MLIYYFQFIIAPLSIQNAKLATSYRSQAVVSHLFNPRAQETVQGHTDLHHDEDKQTSHAFNPSTRKVETVVICLGGIGI